MVEQFARIALFAESMFSHMMLDVAAELSLRCRSEIRLYCDRATLTLHLERTGFTVETVRTPGLLDVDAVRDYWQGGGMNGRTDFLEDLILNPENVDRADAFQAFLSANQLSGYQTVLARAVV